MKYVNVDSLPATPIYSRAVVHNGVAHMSGVTGFNADGQIVEGGLVAEAKQIFSTFDTIFAELGIGLKDVLKFQIFIKEMSPEKLKAFNEAYAVWVGDARPARSAVGVYSLPRGEVEIDVVAAVSE